LTRSASEKLTRSAKDKLTRNASEQRKMNVWLGRKGKLRTTDCLRNSRQEDIALLMGKVSGVGKITCGIRGCQKGKRKEDGSGTRQVVCQDQSLGT